MKDRRGDQLATIVIITALAIAGTSTGVSRGGIAGPASPAGPLAAPGFSSPAEAFTSNNLWLELAGYSNCTATLIVHRPWNDTNLTHDLFYAPDLNPPVDWQFVRRCLNTNLVVGNLCAGEGLFRLGQTNGSLTINSNVTALAMAQMLVPPGVMLTNVKYTGASRACGEFSGGNGCGLPLDSGVILATGDATNAIGPNNLSGATTPYGLPGDPDLDNLVGRGQTFDAAVLEFDIVTTNCCTIGFQYVFASEEYPEWIGSFNDPMAIFVSTNRTATNWVNTNNIALVPGTNLAVSVNTINGGCAATSNGSHVPPTNPQFYVDNHDPGFSATPLYSAPAPVYNIQYDGMTVLLTAQAQISPNVTNHIKIAIEDYGDDLYDSAVFVKAWTPCP
jgi:hypothetical protein